MLLLPTLSIDYILEFIALTSYKADDQWWWCIVIHFESALIGSSYIATQEQIVDH